MGLPDRMVMDKAEAKQDQTDKKNKQDDDQGGDGE